MARRRRDPTAAQLRARATIFCGFVLKILKSVAPSPTRAIEHFQDDRNRAIRLFFRFLLNHPVPP